MLNEHGSEIQYGQHLVFDLHMMCDSQHALCNDDVMEVDPYSAIARMTKMCVHTYNIQSAECKHSY